MTGRRVRVLMRGEELTAGEHRLAWDGKSDAGGALAPGVYQIRFRTAGEVSTARALLVR